jgi:hypothetical protein
MNVKKKKKTIVLHIFVKQTNDACNIILLCVVLVSSFGSSNYVNNIFFVCSSYEFLYLQANKPPSKK